MLMKLKANDTHLFKFNTLHFASSFFGTGKVLETSRNRDIFSFSYLAFILIQLNSVRG